jgi:hypothetical protein
MTVFTEKKPRKPEEKTCNNLEIGMKPVKLQERIERQPELNCQALKVQKSVFFSLPNIAV